MTVSQRKRDSAIEISSTSPSTIWDRLVMPSRRNGNTASEGLSSGLTTFGVAAARSLVVKAQSSR